MARFARVRLCALLLCGILAAIVPLSARMGPSLLMIYGGTLREPVFVRIQTVADLSTYADFWAGRSTAVVPAQLSDRPFFNVAMFWGTHADDEQLRQLKPQNAHQHGRLYVATRDIRAAMVSTAYMQLGSPTGSDSSSAVPLARPVPTDISAFRYGEWLNEGDLRLADKIGVPLRAR